MTPIELSLTSATKVNASFQRSFRFSTPTSRTINIWIIVVAISLVESGQGWIDATP